MADKKTRTPGEIKKYNDVCERYGNLLQYTLKSPIQSTTDGYSEGHIKEVKKDLAAAIKYDDIPLIHGIVKIVKTKYQNYIVEEDEK
ncbi:MAG TPA: hypothetical protein ENG87_02100 [Candidatus Pacearchaeota archaeon]|nr:hypothetical protein BMS3Abin17_00720 [archaeon BMS3Abin17]HDK42146.1 hypothetical protein [Candidatus Pacearchaeota archaeon]HDZ61028.1 hypothetical protein [Candidatus Pacearchaeota archaeon]